jgi:hypothetical protein
MPMGSGKTPQKGLKMDKHIKKSKNQRPQRQDKNIFDDIYTALVNQALLDDDIIITDDIFDIIDDEGDEENDE